MGNFCRKSRPACRSDDNYRSDYSKDESRENLSGTKDIKSKEKLETEKSKNIEDDFIKKCNDFLKQIKINKNNIQIDLLNKKYILYENPNLIIQVSAEMKGGLYNIDNSITKILFTDANTSDDKKLEKEITSLSKEFDKKGVDLKRDYPSFIKEVGNFIIDGKLCFKYEESKFTYEFLIQLEKGKNKINSLKFYGVLKLEIIFKKKPYIINFKTKDETIVFSTIINILIYSYEDKISLIFELLDLFSEENKNEKNIELLDTMKKFFQVENINYSSEIYQ